MLRSVVTISQQITGKAGIHCRQVLEVISQLLVQPTRSVDSTVSNTVPGQWPESPMISPVPIIPTDTLVQDIRMDTSSYSYEANDLAVESEAEMRQCPSTWQLPSKRLGVPVSGVFRQPGENINLWQALASQVSRLPTIPDAQCWPSWYSLERRRQETGLDYPTSDEESEDANEEKLPSIWVRLSRRGEIYLQARLQEALAQVAGLQSKVDFYEQQEGISRSELEAAQQFNEQQLNCLRGYFNQAVQQNEAAIQEQQRRFEVATKSHLKEVENLRQRMKSAEGKHAAALKQQDLNHERTLDDLQDHHKKQLNHLIEEHIAQSDDIEKENEQELDQVTKERDALRQVVDKLKEAESQSAIQRQAEVAMLEEKLGKQQSQSTQTVDTSQHTAFVKQSDPVEHLTQLTNQANKIHELQIQLDQLQHEREQAVKYASRLKSEHEVMQAENLSIQARHNQYEQALQQKDTENSNLKAVIHELEGFRHQMQEREGILNFMDELQTENKKLKEQNNNWKRKYHTDMKHCHQLQKDNAILQSQQTKAASNPTDTVPNESEKIDRLVESYEAKLQKERMDRVKAEGNAYRNSKIIVERDNEIAKLRRVDNMKKTQILAEAKQEISQAKKEKEASQAKVREAFIWEKDSETRTEAVQTKNQRTQEDLEERIQFMKLQVSAGNLQNKHVQTQRAELARAKKQVEEANAGGPATDSLATQSTGGNESSMQEQNQTTDIGTSTASAKRKQDPNEEEIDNDQRLRFKKPELSKKKEWWMSR